VGVDFILMKILRNAPLVKLDIILKQGTILVQDVLMGNNQTPIHQHAIFVQQELFQTKIMNIVLIAQLDIFLKKALLHANCAQEEHFLKLEQENVHIVKRDIIQVQDLKLV
jgi:hypothetical protein